MSREEPEEDEAFYALRAQKRAREFEEESNKDEGILPSERANFAGWVAEGEVPPNVLSELGRIEDEGTFWKAVDWYFERADHLHPVTTNEEIAEDIRKMREEGRHLP